MSSRLSRPQTFDNRSRLDHSRKHVSKPKKQPFNVVECENNNDEEDFGMYTLDLDPLSQPGKWLFALLKLVHDDRMAMVRSHIDSGGSCSTISLGQLRSAFPNIGLDKSKAVLRPYGNGSAIRPCGQVTLTCKRDSRFHMIQLQVLPDTIMQGKPALLSACDSVAMIFLGLRQDMVFELGVDSSKAFRLTKPVSNLLPAPGSLTKDMVVQAYDSVFKGLGCLDPPVSFKVNNAIPLVQMPFHRRPVAKHEKEKATLDI